MHNESGFIRRYQRGRTTSQALSAAQAFRVSATLLILEMTAALGSWIRKAPFAAGLRPRASARFALCIRTFPRRGSDGFTGEPLAPRSWHSLDARQFRVTWFVTSFSCLRAWWHMQTHLSASIRPLTFDVVRQTGSKESAQSRHGHNHDAPRERRQAGDNNSRLADRKALFEFGRSLMCTIESTHHVTPSGANLCRIQPEVQPSLKIVPEQ